MTVILKNNAVSTLTTPISASDTGIVVASGAQFPTLAGGEYFYATLVSPAGTTEIVKVTARVGNSMTVVRAQDGSSAASFTAGSLVEMRVNAASIRELRDEASEVSIADAGNYYTSTNVEGALQKVGADLREQASQERSTVAALLADTTLTYTAGQVGTITAGTVVRTREEGFSYRVAASGASDQHVTTAGGVKLYVLPDGAGAYCLDAFGAVGNGVAVGGIFSGTDDTAAIQSWLNAGRTLKADPDKVYMSGNIYLPHWSGNDIHFLSPVMFAFANCTDTTYGLTDAYWLNNSTNVIRGIKTYGSAITLYGNDHVTNGYVGCMFDARAYLRAIRCLGSGLKFSNVRKNGSTLVASTAVDCDLTVEVQNNGKHGFEQEDTSGSTLTDWTLRVVVASGNGRGGDTTAYDVSIGTGAGWLIKVDRNYSSPGGVYIKKASSATQVHFGQGDSGSVAPSGTFGWGLFVSDIVTSNVFDQASGFVKVSGSLSWPISMGGAGSGSGRRGIHANNLHLNSANGYFLHSQNNPALTFLVTSSIMSEESWTSAFGTSLCPFRFSNTNISAEYIVGDTLVSALNTTINAANVNGRGRPNLTIASGVITIGSASFYRVDTEAAAASDDLDTINGGYYAGQILRLSAANSARTVVLKDGTGNLALAGDFSLTDGADVITLMWNSSSWLEVCRSDNAA